ncbi:hypothetical protein AAVH_17381 [Aphelenchoides avenae]|nr:hypothetical protein AAVH_17381 [Aphelenchus avenae]
MSSKMLPVDDAPLVRPPPPEHPCEGILTMMFIMLGPLGIIGATILVIRLHIRHDAVGKLKSKVRKWWQAKGKPSRKDADPERSAAPPIQQAS